MTSTFSRPLAFEHSVLSQRDVSHPELVQHLQGFAAYVLQGEEPAGR